MIWFDFENAPHVWVFKELVKSFPKSEVIITARNFSSTIGICRHLNIPFEAIGPTTQSSSNAGKFINTIKRAYALRKFLRKNKISPLIAISHGSRSQALASYIMGIKQVFLEDYEHSFNGFHRFVNIILTPFPIEKKAWGKNSTKVIHYPGLKEELYLWNGQNWYNNGILIEKEKINIIFRPEGYNTHYSNHKSQFLQKEIMNLFFRTGNLHIILIARDKIQEKEIVRIFKNEDISYSVPSGTINGPALIAQSDAVIGGGGTMTREACILGVPSYSFFGGKQGDVDKYLESKKLLTYIRNTEDIAKIFLKKREVENDFFIDDKAFIFVKDFITNELNSK